MTITCNQRQIFGSVYNSHDINFGMLRIGILEIRIIIRTFSGRGDEEIVTQSILRTGQHGSIAIISYFNASYCRSMCSSKNKVVAICANALSNECRIGNQPLDFTPASHHA